MPKEKKVLDPVSRRLDAILRVFLDFQRDPDAVMTIADQILVLEDSGLSRGEAGKILGVPSNQISSYVRAATNKKLKVKLEKN